MHEMIEKIYNLKHTPLVTPYNLLENCKISNYNYVKYYKVSDELVCEMECKSLQGNDKHFYFFDEKDFLQRIERESGISLRELLFDRTAEIKNEQERFIESKRNASISL